jgi:hypothetical protein
MKKLLSVLAIVIVLLLAGLYIFIPSNLNIVYYTKFKSPASATERYLSQKEKWNAWWPGTMNPDSSFSYKGYTFFSSKPQPNTIKVDISSKTDTLLTFIALLPLTRDSVGISWMRGEKASSNPVLRFQQYTRRKRLKATMREILDSLHVFMEKQENVYNIGISQTMVTDTLLVTTKSISDHYPSTAEVYQLIGQLRSYISAQGAKAVNPPMLYVHRTDDNRIQTQVAIPVNKPLPDAGNIAFKRMVPGKILVAEIKGGLRAVREAFAQMEFYVEDYEKTSPAIPFEMLVTDRSQESDTTKWVTRIYYPVL